MKTLTKSYLHTITDSGFLKGKRFAKFLASVELVQASLEAGEWTAPRGRDKALAGIGQGIKSKVDQGIPFELYMSLKYGGAFKPGTQLVDADMEATGVPPAVGRAWVALCNEMHEAVKILANARPKAKVTAIKLSPKVTKTLTEMHLDLDLSTIKPAKLVTDSREMLNKDGQVVTVKFLRPEWTPGTVHNQSRFSHCDCHACGKTIPSGRMVPVEVQDRKLGVISLWLGRDCAARIFGVKDIGIEKGWWTAVRS